MTWPELPDPAPGPGEALVRLAVAGVNFLDTGARSRLLPGWSVPMILGVEGMGYVAALGDGVRGLAVGDRVAWVYQRGSYAEQLTVPADSLVRVPDDVGDETAAAVMMQGLTASHFTTETFAVKPGDTAVVTAGAGGVGVMLTQVIKARGGVVIGLVSREEKVAVAKEAGADHVLVSGGGRFEDRVLEPTGREGAHLVYDNGGAGPFRSPPLGPRRHGLPALLRHQLGHPPVRPPDLA